MKIIIFIVSLLVLWSAWGYFSSNVERAKYTVIKKTKDYEIRNYPAHLVAQTTISGSRDEAMNEGFKIVAGYIFGGNVKKESIKMTAPVTDQKVESEKIAMTAPVIMDTEGDSRIISFVMPSKYTIDSLPVPNDPRVKVLEIPEKTFAVKRFFGYRSERKIKKAEDDLREALSKDSVETIGSPSYAGYNAPWTPPWMTRNEVMFELK